MHCILRKLCGYGSQIPAGQSNQACDLTEAALPMLTMQHRNNLVQVSCAMHLNHTLRNPSFAEQKLLVLLQITVLLIQELTYV